MDNLRQYLFRMVCAALFITVVTAFFDKKSSSGAVMRIISTSFILIAAISPFAHFDFSGLREYWNSIEVTAEINSQIGQELKKEAAGEIIKQEITSYILDKAAQYHADLQVHVILADDDLQSPQYIEIEGHISPYGKAQLQTMISNELGVPKENQCWIGQE